MVGCGGIKRENMRIIYIVIGGMKKDSERTFKNQDLSSGTTMIDQFVRCLLGEFAIVLVKLKACFPE